MSSTRACLLGIDLGAGSLKASVVATDDDPLVFHPGPQNVGNAASGQSPV